MNPDSPAREAARETAWRRLHDFPLTGSVPAERDAMAMFDAAYEAVDTTHANALADALDRFFYDLRFTAPEAIGMRLNQLGERINEPMRALGYPKKGPHADRPLADEAPA